MALLKQTVSIFGALKPFSLRFSDRNTERRFLRLHLIGSLWVIRLGLFFGALLYAVFGLLDAYVGGEATGQLWLIRFGLVVPVMTIVLAMTFTRQFLRCAQGLLALAMFTSGLGIVLMCAVAPAPVSHWYYAGLIMVVIYASSIIRLHHTYSLLISMVLVGLYQVSATVLNPLPGDVLVSNNFFLNMSVAVGAMTNYVQEFYSRTKYAQTRLLRVEKTQSDILRRQTEELNATLRHKELILARAQRIGRLGSWEWDLLNDKIHLSDEAKHIFGIGEGVSTISFAERMAIVHAEDRDMVAEVWRASVEERGDYDLEHRIVRPDGSVRVIHEQGELIIGNGGRAVLMSGTTQDFTARQKMADDLRAATMAAETANAAKSQFLANMSHELRTPLNAIIGYSELLSEDAEEQGDSSAVKDLSRINTAGRHLLSLVNDILDLSKIEAGKMELSIGKFNLLKLVRDVQQTVEPLVDRNGNRLLVECSADIGEMTSDATKLRQVLYNLLSNAAKFTEKGDILMRVSGERAGNGSGRPTGVTFTVSDTGIGIALDEMESVFNAFEQTKSRDNDRKGGTGLGLAISRHYCVLMGGTISVDSEPGKGTTFTLWLPAVLRPDAASGIAATPLSIVTGNFRANPG